MIKKSITYTNLDAVQVTKDFYFAMSLNETLAEAADGSFVQKAQEMAAGGIDNATIYKNFAYILEKAIGRRSEDGSYLVKSKEITQGFMDSDAFSVLLFELLNNADQAVEFFTAIFPKNLVEKVNELNGQQTLPEVQLPPEDTRPAWVRENRDPTKAELVNMSHAEMQAAFARKLS